MQGREIGLIGLGKMGKNIAIQMHNKKYDVVVWNRSKDPVRELEKMGVRSAESIESMVSALKPGRTIWVMLPSGDVTVEFITKLLGIMQKGDTVIDGSNSFYKESAMLYERAKEKGINYLDAGCSGGPSGALNGMSIMVGGDKEVFDRYEELFRDLSVKDGYLHTGKAGSGHFVKMAHNAIEYGMMQAIGEGLELIEAGPYKDTDLVKVCRLWNNGSVIRGYLMELAERALSKDRHLSSISPYVQDNGEGRYAVHTAIDYDVPLDIITTSLYTRFESRSDKKFQRRMLAALRHEFGGHDVKTEESR